VWGPSEMCECDIVSLTVLLHAMQGTRSKDSFDEALAAQRAFRPLSSIRAQFLFGDAMTRSSSAWRSMSTQ
jgi:hypothetical protein